MESAYNSFYKALYYLRTGLEQHTGCTGIGQMVVLDRDMLYLAPGLIAGVDAVEFEQAAQVARATDSLADYEQAAALYGGDYLPEDLYEPWAEPRRVALREMYQHTLRVLAYRYMDEGRVADALRVAQRLVQLDPLDEEAHRLVMLFSARMGRRADALRAYRACVEVLRRELNTGPASETIALYRTISAGSLLSEQPAGRPKQSDDHLTGRDVPHLAHTGVPLVGRVAELQRLRELLALDMPAGRLARRIGVSGLWLISGEPGIGKSRLLQELLLVAAASDIAVLAGICSDQEGKLPYGAFVEALRGFLSMMPEAWSRLHLDARLWPLARLLPESLQRLAEQAEKKGTARVPEGTISRSSARQNFFDAIVYLLVEIARAHRGALLALDDLQWADVASLQLLHYLIRRTHGEPLLVVGAARDEGLSPGQPLGKVVADLRRRNLYMPLPLGRLSEEETAACIAYIFAGDSAASAVIVPSLLRYIYQLTEGNPLFIQAVARSLRDSGLVVATHGRWEPAGALVAAVTHPRARSAQQRSPVPETVKDVFAERLERLAPREQRLLALAATAGQSISEDILRHAALATGLSRDEFVDALDTLLRVGLLIEEEGGQLYRFSHALVAETVWERETSVRRRWLHEQIGLARETIYRTRPDGQEQLRTYAAQLAHHFEQAGDTARALSYHFLAAERARVLFANDEAAYHYQAAITLLQAAEHPDAEALTRAWRGLGEAHEWRASHERAQQCFEQALHYATRPEQRVTLYRMLIEVFHNTGRYQEAIALYQRGETELAAAPNTVEWARLQLSVLSAYLLAGRYQEGLSKLEEALPVLLNCGLESEAALAHSRAASASFYAGDMAAAEVHARQGLEYARAAGDRVREGICGHQLAVVHRMQGRTEQALAEIRQAIALKESLGHQVTLAGAYLELAHICGVRNESSDCIRYSQRGLELARETGSLPDEAYGLFLLGRGYELSGEWDHALTTWQEAREILQIAPHPETLCLVDGHTASLLLCRGAIAEARAHCARAIALDWQVAGLMPIVFCLGTQARLALLAGNIAEAADLAGKALHRVVGKGMPEAEARTRLVCATVEYAAGHRERAWEQARHGADLADTYRFVYLQLAARRWLGLIAAQAQRWEIVAQLLTEGMALMEAAPLAYSTAAFASTFAGLLAQRDAERATALYHRAAALLERLRAVVLPPVGEPVGAGNTGHL